MDYTFIAKYTDKVRQKFNSKCDTTLYRKCTHRVDTQWTRFDVTGSPEKAYDENMLHSLRSASTPSMLLSGYLECPMYFNHLRSEILDLFSPDEASQQMIRSLYPELSRPCVSLHIRMGYDANNMCTTNYYKKAIETLRPLVGDAVYLVFSDRDVDISGWGITNYKHVVGHPDYVDLWTMSQCVFNITTYSTFSWWGAYLNNHPNKVVTYPRSALLYIQSKNGRNEDDIHNHYFLGATQIDDTK